MIGLADENGREYECIYGTYSRDKGFNFNDSIFAITQEGEGWRGLINMLFHEDLWKLSPKEEPKDMTHEEIEKELGYRVNIVDPEPDKKIVSEERKKQIDNYIDFIQRFLGIDLDDENYY